MKKATTTMTKKKSNREDVDVMDYEARARLQAVLLADSFSNSFRPVSLDRPQVLCPLNNVAMLDYSIEFLAGAGVAEVFCMCTSDDVEQHVSTMKMTGEMKITCINDSSLTNAGDALRELDKRNLVQSNPFLLMHGDVVANVDLTAIIQKHKQRNKQDSSSIMTLLFQKVGPHSKLRPPSSDLIVGMDPRDNRILQYDDHAPSSTNKLPCSYFGSHAQIELRDDLIDCGLDVCSPQVLARFSDEFDYRDIRREFVTNTVAEEEQSLQNKLYAHVLDKSHYAARITDFAAYHTVSRDLLNRWCYPVVPDNLALGYVTKYRYEMQKQFLYKDQARPTKFGQSSTITGPGMVGSDGHVGKNCRITGTVIGHDCSIGDGVTLRDCHVWDGVTIEDGVTAEKSILANGVVIKKGAVLSRGCIVGSGCVIGANVVLPEYTRITQAADTDGQQENHFDSFSSLEEDSSEDSTMEVEPQDVAPRIDDEVVGYDGIGRVWQLPSIQDDDDEQDDEFEQQIQLLLHKAQSIGCDRSALDQELSILYQDRYERQEENAGDDEDGSDFDVVEEFKKICLEHTGETDNLLIELKSYKFGQNATFADCTMGATLAMLEKLTITENTSEGQLLSSLKKALEYWAPVFEALEQEGLEEELGIITALEMATMSETPMGSALSIAPAFRLMLQTLYDKDVLSEEAILEWAAQRRQEDPNSPLGKLFRQKQPKTLSNGSKQTREEDDSSEEEGQESD